MARLEFAPYRRKMWEIVDACSSCERAECPEWCAETVSQQMDELIEEIARAAPSSRAETPES